MIFFKEQCVFNIFFQLKLDNEMLDFAGKQFKPSLDIMKTQ